MAKAAKAKAKAKPPAGGDLHVARAAKVAAKDARILRKDMIEQKMKWFEKVEVPTAIAEGRPISYPASDE